MNELYALGATYGEPVQAKLWALLRRQALDYTLGDSDSLPQEVAEELFRSVLYTLRLFFDATGEGLQALAQADENALFDRALRFLEQEIDRCKERYALALRCAPAIPHRALRDTLQNIGLGLKRYPYRHFAHQVPGEIDYQLCLPVPEERLGISYLTEYLDRLTTESLFLRFFDPRACVRLLSGRFPEYSELLINLYEPVLTRALGNALAGAPVDVALEQRAQVAAVGSRLNEPELRTAAQRLCGETGLPPERRGYVEACALEWLPRLRVAAENGTLENLL